MPAAMPDDCAPHVGTSRDGGQVRSVAQRLDGIDRLELVVLVLNVATTFALIAVVSVRELPFVWSTFPRPATVIAGLLTVGLLFRFGWCQEWISRFASALALQLWTGLATTCLLFATLGLQFPRIDAGLAAADRALGFDTLGLIAWFAASPVITAWLYWAYSYQGLSAFVIAALAFIGRTDRLTEQMFIFSAGLVLASLLSIPFPAHGPFAHLAVPSGVSAALPAGSGVYYLPVMEGYRSGALRTIDLSQLMGMIQFPSFHVYMALMMTWSVRGMRWIFWPVALFNLAAGISALPIGGHYVADMIGGAILFAAMAALARTIRSHTGPDVRVLSF